MIYKTRTIKDVAINDSPEFNQGDMEVSRLAGGIDIGSTYMTVIKSVKEEREVAVETNTDISYFTVSHNLSYVPLVIGEYWVTTGVEKRQPFGQARTLDNGLFVQTWIHDITESIILVGYNAYDDGSYGDSSLDIKYVFHFFNVEAI